MSLKRTLADNTLSLKYEEAKSTSSESLHLRTRKNASFRNPTSGVTVITIWNIANQNRVSLKAMRWLKTVYNHLYFSDKIQFQEYLEVIASTFEMCIMNCSLKFNDFHMSDFFPVPVSLKMYWCWENDSNLWMQLNIVYAIFSSLKQKWAQICGLVFISISRGISSLLGFNVQSILTT